MKRNERARQVLGRFGDVVWFRSPVERHPIYGYRQVAFVGWRFAEPHEELKEVFESAVRQASTQVEWTFRPVRNWMIVPTRLIQEAGPNAQHFNEAMDAIRESDQDFCAATAVDLEGIFRVLSGNPAREGSPSGKSKCPIK
ncbi:hypothetical protein OG257_08040 [Streptomyces sp. NBC_00683]|uniref:hypothetical protein n=1 Tax=Streptomyces sp. NBC_00683 TaxID=2903670 RepID=UPI002E30862D|nr:hypothetical protein [Streptomyces sp. NBC_00683]